MPIGYTQITNFMKSKTYQDENHPAHKQANDFVDVWFHNYADKLDENNNFKEDVALKPVVSKRTVSDDDLIKRNIPEIKKHEGVKNFPYKDTKGILTVGGGLNVNQFDTYAGLGWVHKDTGQKATFDEIKAEYEYIKQAPVGNYRADFYKTYTNLRLPDSEIDAQMAAHLKNDLVQIRNFMPEFDLLPAGMQDATIDLQYNTGHIEKFPKYRQAIRDKDVVGVIRESHRKNVSEERNMNMVKKILQDAEWNY